MTKLSKAQSAQFNGVARRAMARTAARLVGLNVYQVRNHAGYHTVVFDRVVTGEELERFRNRYSVK